MIDRILTNAHILTLDPRMPVAELIAIEQGVIRKVSGNASLGKLKCSKTHVIDCKGHTVLPGFIDAHCHVGSSAKRFLTLELSPAAGVHTIRDIQSRIRAQSRLLPRGAWILAGGYHEYDLREKRHPNRWDLDEAAPCHPVELAHRTGHAHVLNSLALREVGLSMESGDPEGGLMDRDLATGEPTGLLYEMGRFLKERVPPLGEREMESGIRQANRQFLSMGITSLHDASCRDDPGYAEQLRRWKEKGLLSPKVGLMFGPGNLEGGSLKRFTWKENPAHLRPLGMKIILDETTGRLHPPQEEINRWVLLAHSLGLQTAIHAVEETSVESACHAIDSALRQMPRPDPRHRVEHAFLCTPSQADRLAELGVQVVTQPGFLYQNGDRYLKAVPKEKHANLYPIATLLKAGVPVSAGSDSPVGPVNPFLGVYGAVFRTTLKGNRINPRENISISDALALYTIQAARAGFEEEIKGSITPGKAADLIVLKGSLEREWKDGIRELKVDLTLVDGNIVWSRAS